MHTFWKISLVFVAWSLFDCTCDQARIAPPAPTEVVRDFGYFAESWEVDIKGENFLIKVWLDLAKGDQFEVDNSFTAVLEHQQEPGDPVVLQNVEYQDIQTLSATIPANIAIGMYTLTITGPYGLSGSLENAYRATDQEPECETSADCENPTPVCSPQRLCVACQNDPECLAINPDTPLCETGTGACVECSGSGLCDDANPCTDDECIDNACVFINNAAACDDGNECTRDDACSDGSCQSGPSQPDGTACDGGAGVCCLGVCQTGECCANPDCDDSNPCTDDSCQGFVCQHQSNNAACEDGQECTVGDTCTGGACQAGAPAVDLTACAAGTGVCCAGACQTGDCCQDSHCDDTNPCTDDSCPGFVCTFTDNTVLCDDGNECTDPDRCSAGVCQGLPLIDMFACDSGSGVCCSGSCHTGNCCIDTDCNDLNPCTSDPCTAHVCANAPNTIPCDDGEECTEDDTCSGGACQSGPAAPDLTVCDGGAGVCCSGTCSSGSGTHDEDLDGVPDACDNCPTVPNPGQEDDLEVGASGVADGVGDACDPRPTGEGDAIVFFDGFDTDLSDFVVYTGSWSVSGDAVHQTNSNLGGALLMVPGLDYGEVVVDTLMRFDVLAPTNSNAGPAFRLSPTIDGWNCALRKAGPDNHLRHYRLNANAGLAPATMVYPGTIEEGTFYLLRAWGHGLDTGCDADAGAAWTTWNDAQFQSGTIGIRSTRCAITAEYLVAYSLGGPLP